jgi:metal-responsive CopG/Arc/MetJ family transcriptional regulator
MCVVHCTSMASSTIVATMDMTVKLGITLPKSIIQKIDQKRGDIPRSRYIRRAIERYLGNNSKDIDSIDNDNKATTVIKKRRRKIGK